MPTSTMAISTIDTAEPSGKFALAAELPRYQVSNHQPPRPAEQVGGDVRANRWDKDQHRARHDPRQRQRKHHPPKGLPVVCTQVIRRLDKAKVQPVDGGVDRQNHKGQVAVHQPQRDRKGGKEQLEWSPPKGQLGDKGIQNSVRTQNRL